MMIVTPSTDDLTPLLVSHPIPYPSHFIWQLGWLCFIGGFATHQRNETNDIKALKISSSFFVYWGTSCLSLRYLRRLWKNGVSLGEKVLQ
jgi:hypothetical protein